MSRTRPINERTTITDPEEVRTVELLGFKNNALVNLLPDAFRGEKGDTPTDVVRTVSQSLDAGEQTQVRANIGIPALLAGKIDTADRGADDGVAELEGGLLPLDRVPALPIDRTTGLQTALDAKLAASQVGVAGGAASLDADGELPIVMAPRERQSIADFEATAFARSRKKCFIQGFSEPFDGGGALYRRVLSEPSHNCKVRSLDRWTSAGVLDALNGGWWELDSRKPNIAMRGAVANAVYSAVFSGYTGTDCSPALRDIAEYAWAKGRQIYVPDGMWRFARPNTASNTRALTIPPGSKTLIVGPGREQCTLCCDEDVTVEQPTNACIYVNDNGTGVLEFKDLSFRGLFTQHPWDVSVLNDTTLWKRGLRFVEANGLKRISFKNCGIYDCRWTATFGRNNKEVRLINNDVQRCASDTMRFLDSSDVLCAHNVLRDIDDDCISFHTSDEAAEGRPVRGRILVAFNIMENCEGLTVLGAHTIIVHGNIGSRLHGSGLVVGSYNPPEGNASGCLIIVTDNMVIDPLVRYDPESEAWTADSVQNGAITVGGSILKPNANGDYPTYYSSTDGEVKEPYAIMDAAAPWGAMNIIDWWDQGGDSDVYANAGARNISVRGNKVLRTLPNVPNFSNWGHGQYFSRAGYFDPPVTEAARRGTCLAMLGDMQGFSVVDNDLYDGKEAGIFFYLPPQSTVGDLEFRDGLVAFNRIKNCKQPITTSLRTSGAVAADWKTWDIDFIHNNLDGDPYHKHALRTLPLDGTFTFSNIDANRPDGINLRGLKGCRVRFNIFANVYSPVAANASPWEQHDIEGNIVKCQPVAVGYNAGNKGVADVPLGGVGFRHHIHVCNPTSADYGKLLNLALLESSAMPTAGTFVQGHRVVRRNPTASISAGQMVTGYIRATTGTGHVSGTDWYTEKVAVS